MPRYDWNRLTKQQLGKFAEYFVKMELTLYGFQVFGTEVDDRGIDFVTRYGKGPFLQVQVKSVRDTGYVFMEKSKFALHEHLLLAFALLTSGNAPELYLIPSQTWENCVAGETAFVDRNYGEGLKSAPEYGLNVSKRNLPKLEQFRFETAVEKLVQQAECSTTGRDRDP